EDGIRDLTVTGVQTCALPISAEQARDRAIEQNFGKYVLVVDGGIPLDRDGYYSTTGGKSGRDLVCEAAKGAALIIAVGTCATYRSEEHTSELQSQSNLVCRLL